MSHQDHDNDDQIVPEGRVIEARFVFAVPAAATRRQILEWVKQQLEGMPCDGDNPLDQAGEIEALSEPVLTDTGHRYRERVVPYVENPNHRRIYRWTEPDDR